ncbi:DUF1611 domain-containing protein [Marinicaulis aureus]|uniref:DUF1611 domain-containing protein n=1 Tax=Hyphococcus aureus TaxID=2666033 RepID=A0ABW1L2Q1_9PROT
MSLASQSFAEKVEPREGAGNEGVKRFKAPYLIYFGDIELTGYAKTGLGLIEWRRNLCIGQYRTPQCSIDSGLPDMTIEEAVQAGVGSFVIGVAPAGGYIPDRWLQDLVKAARAGLDIISGMHARLTDFPEIVEAALASGARLFDVRTPPADLPLGTGAKRTGKRLLTVGTDCAVGKKYTALAIEKEMQARRWKADFRATGQTGVMIAGAGFAIDCVVADFLSGAAELISPAADDDHWDVIEGQGALSHPSFAGVSLGLLHGSQPDALVLCHDPTRVYNLGTERKQPYPLHSLQETIEANLLMARRVNPDARFVGMSVNTSQLPLSEKPALFERLSAETGLPVIDPIKDGAKLIVDRIEKEFLL